MAQQTVQTVITAAEIEKWVDSESDFGFELKVFSSLMLHSMKCEHGGTYEDPVTGKPRQFDIRCYIRGPKCIVNLAIECKNLTANFPLVVQCVPRLSWESRHSLIYSIENTVFEQANSTRIDLCESESYYQVGEFVGKSCAQVGFKNKDLIGSDADVYDKWAQAISSSYELVKISDSDWRRVSSKEAFSAVVPILVVPNDMLWIVKYDSDGKRISPPERARQIPFFLDKQVALDRPKMDFRISHLEIMTVDGLLLLVQDLVFSRGSFNRFFPGSGIIEKTNQYRNGGTQ